MNTNPDVPADFDAPELPPALREEVRADCRALAARRRKALAVVSLLGLAASAGLAATMEMRAPAYGTPLHTLVLAGYGVGGLALCAFAFGLPLPSGRRLVPVGAVALGAVLGSLLLFVREGADAGPAVSFAHGAVCLGTGFLVSLAVMGLAFAMGRRLLRRHAPTGLLLGAGAGMLGLIPLHTACTVCSASHLMVWHALVPLASGAAAALAWSLLRPEPELESS